MSENFIPSYRNKPEPPIKPVTNTEESYSPDIQEKLKSYEESLQKQRDSIKNLMNLLAEKEELIVTSKLGLTRSKVSRFNDGLSYIAYLIFWSVVVILQDSLTNKDKAYSSKKLMTFVSFNLCVFMGLVDMFTKYKINPEIFYSFLAMSGGQTVLSMVSTFKNEKKI